MHYILWILQLPLGMLWKQGNDSLGVAKSMQAIFAMVSVISVGEHGHSVPLITKHFILSPKRINCSQLLIKTFFVLWHLRPEGPR